MKDMLKRMAMLSLASFAVVALVGCGVTDPAEDEDVISTMTVTSDGAVTAGTAEVITVKLESSPAIDSVVVLVKNSAGTAVPSTEITVTGEDALDGQEDGTLSLSLTALAGTACNGSYTVSITVYAGTASQTKTSPVTVSGGKDCGAPVSDITDTTLTLGSWNNTTVGSSLDADAMRVYSRTEAANNSAAIDIWYSNEADGSDAFYSPSQAATIQHPPKDWATKNQTQMAIATGVTFESITLQSEINAAWAAVSAANKKQLVRPTDGDVVLVQTDQGKIVMIKFLSGDGTNTGTCQIKGTK